ncbi:MAG TPA: 23S rRNA (uracil(1939)-C(5))-methyltransferase RlmD [Gammaproteobacteria bacterium]|nr:23S rRNA (uracil(1939)-C(5))-methyltransferase RlmD [Gammaproteobacteria bacterium]
MRNAARRAERVSSTVLQDIVVHSLSHDGRGIARVEGKTVFVAGALPGERVNARLERQRRDFDEARVADILEAAPERVTPRCAHFGVCGGCSLQHLAPAAQLAAKQQTLLDNLQHIGQVQPDTLLPPQPGPVWGYRRRARLSARYVHAKRRVLVGFVERGKPFITDTRHCDILDPHVGALIEPLSVLLGSLGIAAQVPQVELAVGDRHTVLVLRVLSEPDAQDRQRLAEFEQAHGVHIYLQSGKPDALEPLSGQRVPLGYALPEWGVELEFEPADFIQINAAMNRSLIARALELLACEASHRVLDLFCGLGNFTLPLARVAAEVTGVEGDPGLIRRARLNAERNGIANARFQHADLFADPGAAPWAHSQYDRILLDPPRAGAREVITHFDRFNAGSVVYVSCHPATLARDAAQLVREQGYRLRAAGVLDMFPHTAHVESIALFERSGT